MLVQPPRSSASGSHNARDSSVWLHNTPNSSAHEAGSTSRVLDASHLRGARLRAAAEGVGLSKPGVQCAAPAPTLATPAAETVGEQGASRAVAPSLSASGALSCKVTAPADGVPRTSVTQVCGVLLSAGCVRGAVVSRVRAGCCRQQGVRGALAFRVRAGPGSPLHHRQLCGRASVTTAPSTAVWPSLCHHCTITCCVAGSSLAGGSICCWQVKHFLLTGGLNRPQYKI